MGAFDTFMYHVENGNLSEVMNCFESYFLEGTTVDFWRLQPIHVACSRGHLTIVKFLVQNKCNIECKDNLMRRPIHVACSKGHLEIVKFLVQNKCSIECENEWKMLPIHYSCRDGHLELVKFLCEGKCKLDCKTLEGDTPVDLAKRKGKTDCVKYLNEILKSQNIFDCVRRDDVQVLDALYNPAIFNIEEYETGLLLLEVALQSKTDKTINYLLDKLVNNSEIWTLKNYMKDCSRPDRVQLFQECLLYRSIRFHDADEFHLASKAKIINEHSKIIKSSFLQIAAEFGCNAFIYALLKKSIYNEEEWTKAKELAIVKGHVAIAEAISDRKILLRNRAQKKFTWLHSAVCDNDLDMVKYVLERNFVNPDFNNKVVGTRLDLSHLMCYDKCQCSYLVSRTKYIDRPGFMGLTGLQYAVVRGFEEICNELVKKRADCVQYVEILCQSSIKKTVLPISKRESAVTLCMKIHKRIYSCFLAKLNRDMVKSCDGDGNSLLHLAVKILQPDLCRTLIKSDSNVEAINDQGNSPLFELFCSVDNSHANVEKAIATLNVFVEYGIDLNTKSKSGLTALKGASRWNSERLMISLLSKQSRVTCVTKTDLILAFTKHWFRYITTLISIMTEVCLQAAITDEIFYLAMAHCDSRLLMSVFEKSLPTVQQLVIEDLLDHFTLEDKYDEFLELLKIEITRPKFFSNGETLLTSLLKKEISNTVGQ